MLFQPDGAASALRPALGTLRNAEFLPVFSDASPGEVDSLLPEFIRYFLVREGVLLVFGLHNGFDLLHEKFMAYLAGTRLHPLHEKRPELIDTHGSIGPSPLDHAVKGRDMHAETLSRLGLGDWGKMHRSALQKIFLILCHEFSHFFDVRLPLIQGFEKIKGSLHPFSELFLLFW